MNIDIMTEYSSGVYDAICDIISKNSGEVACTPLVSQGDMAAVPGEGIV
jgi:hypothetical protein